jgi:hypothetical protein
MSEPERLPGKPAVEEANDPPNGPSLALIYSLIGLGLLVAMVIAGFIVLPFYHRH